MTDEIVIRLGLFGTDAIKLPVNKELKDAIREHVYGCIKEVLSEEKLIINTVCRMLLTNKDYTKKLLTPILKEIIEDLEIRFTSD